MAYYIQTNVVCIVMLLILYRQSLSGKGMVPARHLAFRKLIWASVILCVSDSVAWLCNGLDFKGVTMLLQASNIVYYGATTWVCWAWLNYVEICVGMLRYDRRGTSYVALIPALLMTVLLLTNPYSGLMFTIDANNVYARGPLVSLHWIVSWGYLIAATIIVFFKYRQAQTRMEKKELASLLLFIVMPVIAAVVQMMFYGVTIMQCGISLSIMMIVSDNVREQISNDVLTGLNNRRAFESFVDESILKFGKNFTLIMCDIDKFKSINDTYGHAYGDIALKRIAGVLKDACNDSKLSLFLCRYGGDEFIICGADIALSELLKLKQLINDRIEECNREHTEQGDLSISMGISSSVCWTENDVDRLVRTADQEMYKNKNGRR